jgi:hypothetical protein
MLPDLPTKEEVKLQLQQSAFLVFILVGVSTVLALLYNLSPALPFVPGGQGATEVRLREETISAWNTAQLPVPSCEYSSKQFALTCSASEQNRQQVIAALKSRGWKESFDTGKAVNMQRDRDSLSLTCNQLQSTSGCTFRLQFHLR